MASISASFRNDTSESKSWIIVDLARDPNNPPAVFSGFLDPDQSTGDLTLYSADGLWGRVQYGGSGGASTIVDVSQGDEVRMK